MKKIFIHTLGCKVNQFESASFQSSLEKQGCNVVGPDTESDIVIINTCAVTGKAGAQSRQVVRKAARANPNAKIIVTGCYAQIAAKEIAEMDELQNHPLCIIGNSDKDTLVDTALLAKPCAPSVHMDKIAHQKEICKLPVQGFGGRTRAFLRVQDGCDSYCSYCIVPYARGRSRSLPVAEVVKQARTFQREGHREIVITGIHVGYYGKDLDEQTDITCLMEKLCRETPDIRYRLSSIEPLEINEKLLQIMAQHVNFMPHLHIPLQSGNDEILLRMNRRYTTGQFAEVLALCQDRIPDIAIGIDLLAGFPGEDEKHFVQTQSFLEKIDYTYLHVFPYSQRPGTPAATFANQVSKSVKEKRVALLRKLGKEKKKAFYRQNLGKIRPVLVEKKRDNHGLLKGFTDNYIPVSFQGDDMLINSIVDVRIDTVDDTYVVGSHVAGDE